VCALRDVTHDRGVAALVDGHQIAVFRLSGDDEILAIGNIDPFSGASVLSRGIVGSRGDATTVASPIYKQRFDLHSGRCLDDDGVSVPTYRVRVVGDWIEISV
jgi:nitrite reductase (NADH) small subunit